MYIWKLPERKKCITPDWPDVVGLDKNIGYTSSLISPAGQGTENSWLVKSLSRTLIVGAMMVELREKK